MKTNNRILMDERLNNDYIAGFIHGNGGFSVTLGIRKNKNNEKLYLLPTFTLTQHNRNISLIKKIIERFDNIGTYRIDNKNIIKYRVRDINNIMNTIIPFFDKYQLKSEKLLIFIKLKFIVEKLNSIDDNYKWYSRNLDNKYNELILDLITISVNMNTNVKPSVQLKYLSEKDKVKVLNNELSPIILKELNNYILNYNYKNDLNIDFINGLFDSDGWITLRLQLNKSKTSIGMGWEYGIVSDLLNKELLYEIKKYFNNVGSLRERKDEKSISYIVTKSDCISEVFPKMYNVSNYIDIFDDKVSTSLKNREVGNKGPIIKDLKIKDILNILKLYDEYKKNKNNKIILENILLLSYKIRDINLKNKEPLNDYLIRMKKKLNI